MELTISERLTLLNGLPVKGDITTIRIVRKLREQLSFTEVEHNRHNFRNEGELLRWDHAAEAAEMNFGHKAKSIIIEVLEKASVDGNLTEEHISLWDKFVENNKEK